MQIRKSIAYLLRGFFFYCVTASLYFKSSIKIIALTSAVPRMSSSCTLDHALWEYRTTRDAKAATTVISMDYHEGAKVLCC